MVLGLMVFLAATAACSSETYDPDPYDDAPPVVSLEFSYVIPWQLGIRPGHGIQGGRVNGPRRDRSRQTSFSLPADVNNEKTSSSVPQAPPQLFQPLRR
jgi:hypothetical protein